MADHYSRLTGAVRFNHHTPHRPRGFIADIARGDIEGRCEFPIGDKIHCQVRICQMSNGISSGNTLEHKTLQ